MADPVGAPTFAQMFSPSKSPFYALTLFALVCLSSILNKPLANYGTGILLLVLLGAFVLAPFFRPKYSDRTYGLSLMFGRSAALIGAMIALALLIAESEVPGSPNPARLFAESPMFNVVRACILTQLAAMAILFGFRTRPRKAECGRYNFIQFCLMQSTLLIFIAIMANNAPNPMAGFGEVWRDGWAMLFSLGNQIVGRIDYSAQIIVFPLILIFWINAAMNLLLILASVEFGWIQDHGDGVSE